MKAAPTCFLRGERSEQPLLKAMLNAAPMRSELVSRRPLERACAEPMTCQREQSSSPFLPSSLGTRGASATTYCALGRLLSTPLSHLPHLSRSIRGTQVQEAYTVVHDVGVHDPEKNQPPKKRILLPVRISSPSSCWPEDIPPSTYQKTPGYVIVSLPPPSTNTIAKRVLTIQHGVS